MRGKVEYEVVDLGYKTPCWIWLKCRVKNGYGRAGVPGTRLVRYAHIVVYERTKGPVPTGLQLDHLCRQRASVNPDHLEPVTQAVNLRRGIRTRLSEDLVVEMFRLRKQGMLQRELAVHFSIPPRSTISMALNGHTWKGVCYPG